VDVSAILRGEVGPAARLMRDLDDDAPEARELLRLFGFPFPVEEAQQAA